MKYILNNYSWVNSLWYRRPNGLSVLLRLCWSETPTRFVFASTSLESLHFHCPFWNSKTYFCGLCDIHLNCDISRQVFFLAQNIFQLWIKSQSFCHDKKQITRWLEDMNFNFSCWKTPLENKIHIFAQTSIYFKLWRIYVNLVFICINYVIYINLQ